MGRFAADVYVDERLGEKFVEGLLLWWSGCHCYLLLLLLLLFCFFFVFFCLGGFKLGVYRESKGDGGRGLGGEDRDRSM